jgi:hypothetical protein
MPQISLYIDEETLKKVNKAALLSRVSISDWVSKKIKSSLKNSWPPEYFALFGSISDSSFKRPRQNHHKKDIEREAL